MTGGRIRNTSTYASLVYAFVASGIGSDMDPEPRTPGLYPI